MVEFSEDTHAQMQGCWRASEPSVCGDGSGCRQGLMEHDSLIPLPVSVVLQSKSRVRLFATPWIVAG